MTGTKTIQISEATYQALMEEIGQRGVTLEEFLQSVLPRNDAAEESDEAIGERLERKGLIGLIDSSQPPDPASPPQRGPLFDLIADKLRKQGLIVP